jgi:DNA-binding NarL/FixJ family response regulator
MTAANILIVEDDDPTAQLINVLLAGRGHNVCGIVSSGEKAVDMTIKTTPDLVLMDIRLDGRIDGITASEQIKKVVDVPIIFISTYTDRETIDRAVQCNPSGYIVKPFRSEDLLRKVESALDWKRICSEA